MLNTKSRNSEKYRFGHKLQLKCNDGFQLHGDNFIYCMANGKWSKVQSICTSKLNDYVIDFERIISILHSLQRYNEVRYQSILPVNAEILNFRTDERFKFIVGYL